MPEYINCSDVDSMVDKMLATLCLFTPDHSSLEKEKVTINTLFAYPKCDKRGKAVEAAISVGGYPAAACIKITSYKDRVKGLCDAELRIDHAWWEGHNQDECKALLDHELTHLVIVEDKYGRPKRDQAGRPRLKMRLHDMQVGWFHSIARRHGRDSAEWQQAQKLMEPACTKIYFDRYVIVSADAVTLAVRAEEAKNEKILHEAAAVLARVEILKTEIGNTPENTEPAPGVIEVPQSAEAPVAA
jgi:Putative phage metallopeptidase